MKSFYDSIREKYNEWQKNEDKRQEMDSWFIEAMEFIEESKKEGHPVGMPAGTPADEEAEFWMELASVMLSYLEYKQEEMEKETSIFYSPPKPLDEVEITPFPIDCLPDVVADYVKAVAENTQTAFEMGGVLALGVLATIMQGKYKVQVKQDYSEPVSLYTVAIAAPGERKSAVIKHLTAYINEYESDFNKKIASDVKQNEMDKRILEGEIKRLESTIIRGNGDDDTKSELDCKIKELTDFKEVHFLRLLVDDTTPEKLIDIMDRQGGKIGICSAEGNLFDLLSAKNDRGTLLINPLLKGWGGDKLTVDRMGRESNIIENPHISTILTIQPSVVDKIMINGEFGGRGLIPRFLFVRCGSFIGERSATSPDIPNEVKTKYRNLVFELLDYKENRTFLLSEEAQEEWQRFHDMVEKRLVNEWHFMTDFGNKFRGTAIRIAGLIHGAENSGGKFYTDYISGETLRRAIKIAECLGKHAEAIYLRSGTDEVIEKAKYIISRLRKEKKYEFTKSEMLGLCQKYKANELSASIELLEECQYIRVVKTESGGKGRPSEKIILSDDID